MRSSSPRAQLVPRPWSPWQRRVAAIGGVALKLTPLLLAVVLIGMMIWTALPRPGTSTVQVDPNNIFVSDNAHLLSAETKTAIHKMNTRYKQLAHHPHDHGGSLTDRHNDRTVHP
ncbi:hypothetical protein [Lacticaseibacillus absianus]|uniref:hypothetical protein n=1 Tax=Lacticaseibacillus absianus TaxID=2729623 RepID=UPI0015C6F3E5|nr:hypothetical protein [Lacticaseibacillus absianus]